MTLLPWQSGCELLQKDFKKTENYGRLLQSSKANQLFGQKDSLDNEL